MSTSTPAVVVHTTPPLAPLPASDAASLRLLGLLRLAGLDFGLTTADWSANGKPFVTHDGIAIPARHLPSLPHYTNPDASLTSSQRAECLEWTAYIEGRLVDLVNHTMYSLPPNYPVLARAQLAACPFPLNQYVPQRIRGIHKARLEHIGIWGLGGANAGEPEEDRKRLQDSMIIGPGGTQAPRAWSWNSGREATDRQRKFGEEALRTRARDVLDPLVRKIGQGRYFFGSRPSTLDIALWAQLTLLLEVAWPNALMADLLRSTYPTLVAHHDRVAKKLGAWPSRIPPPPRPSLVEQLRAYLPEWAGGPAGVKVITPEAQAAEEKDRKFRFGRYAWYAGAGIAFVTYVLGSGIVSVQLGEEEEGEWIDGEELEGEFVDEEEDEEMDEERDIVLPPRKFSALPVWDDDEEEAEAEAEEEAREDAVEEAIE